MKVRDVHRLLTSDLIDTMKAMKYYCQTRACKDCPFENDTDDPHYYCFLSGSSPEKWKIDILRRPEVEKED